MSFNTTYAACRDEFRLWSTILNAEFMSKGYSVEQQKICVPSNEFLSLEDLTIDCFYAKPGKEADRKRLFILGSGTHGIEGYVGSAIQTMFMRDMAKLVAATGNMGLLLIHSINPYGHSRGRRVTENNVDMNRNFDISGQLYSTANEGYDALDDFLNPVTPYSPRNIDEMLFVPRAIGKVARKGIRTLRQAILQGQYRNDKGIFFGGFAPEPQVHKLEQMLKVNMAGYDKVLAVDLHTGYGERGRLHVFSLDQVDDPQSAFFLQKLFRGYSIETGNDDDFYKVSGSFCEFIYRLCTDGQVCIPTAFEFGTLDSQKLIGSLNSLRNMIRENRIVQHGVRNEAGSARALDRFREMFCPSDLEWRRSVMEQSRRALSIVLERFSAM